MICESLTCILLWSSWKRAGSPSMSATISPSNTSDRFVCDDSFWSEATISGNCFALSFPFLVMSLTSLGVA